MELAQDGSAAAALERQRQALAVLERRSLAKSLVLPTSDDLVRRRLRELAEPISVFAESVAERRERLKNTLVLRGINEGMPGKSGVGVLYGRRLGGAAQAGAGAGAGDDDDVDMDGDAGGRQRELFYTEGTDLLRGRRMELAKASLAAADTRLRLQRKRAAELVAYGDRCKAEAVQAAKEGRPYVPKETNMLLDQATKVVTAARTVSAVASQYGDERPISCCQFDAAGARLATGSWSTMVKVWDASSCELLESKRGHTERVAGVAFHPRGDAGSTIDLASGAADRLVMLWERGKPTAAATLSGHLDRVTAVAWHPLGTMVGSASMDKSWRLWDVERRQELLLQDGHSRGLFSVAFHRDGSLAASAGADAITRVWDLRTGRSIMVLQGHVQKVLSVDFAPNGFLLATGSEDHVARVWDLRQRRTLRALPAHTSSVCRVRFHPLATDADSFLATGSFDKTIRIWSASSWQLVRSLAGHDSKVMGLDVAPTEPTRPTLASSSYDRTWKLWQ